MKYLLICMLLVNVCFAEPCLESDGLEIYETLHNCRIELRDLQHKYIKLEDSYKYELSYLKEKQASENVAYLIFGIMGTIVASSLFYNKVMKGRR